MIKTTSASALALAATLALLVGCKSDDPPTVEVDLTEVECICGTEMEAVDGCACPLCVTGKRNPDNPDCVCGPIDVNPEDDQ